MSNKRILIQVNCTIDDERNTETHMSTKAELTGEQMAWCLAELTHCVGRAVEQCITSRLFTVEQFKDALETMKAAAESHGRIEKQ